MQWVNIVIQGILVVVGLFFFWAAFLHLRARRHFEEAKIEIQETNFRNNQQVDLLLSTQAAYFAQFVAVLAVTYKGSIKLQGDQAHVYIPLPTGLIGYSIHKDYLHFYSKLPVTDIEFPMPYPLESTLKSINEFITDKVD